MTDKCEGRRTYKIQRLRDRKTEGLKEMVIEKNIVLVAEKNTKTPPNISLYVFVLGDKLLHITARNIP